MACIATAALRPALRVQTSVQRRAVVMQASGQGFGKPSAQAASRASGKRGKSSGATVSDDETAEQDGWPKLSRELVEAMEPKNELMFMGLYSVTPGLEDSVDIDDLPVGKYATVTSFPIFSLLYCGEEYDGDLPAAQLAAQLSIPAGAVQAASVTVTKLNGPPMLDGIDVLGAMLGVEAPANLPCVGYARLAMHRSPNGNTSVVEHLEVPEQLRGHGLGLLLFHRLTRATPKGSPLLPLAPDRSSWGFWRKSATLKEQLALVIERDGMAASRAFCCGPLKWGEELFDSLV